MTRIHCPQVLQSGQTLVLTDAAARHVQVLRHQPGDTLTLFDGGMGIGGEFEATVLRMGRSDVEVQINTHQTIEREAAQAVHLAVGMPANERMDWLVEKATELGVASIQPLMTERTVLRLSGERAAKKQAHWQSIAVAACEQCGRNRVPMVHPVLNLEQWLKTQAECLDTGIGIGIGFGDSATTFAESSAPKPGHRSGLRFVLSLQPGAAEWRQSLSTSLPITFLSGPEGGLSAAEESSARLVGFSPASLGPRVLRAETAALAALTAITLNL